jgi:hypothetical protein
VYVLSRWAGRHIGWLQPQRLQPELLRKQTSRRTDTVRLADDPLATSITVRRGIPTTLNTPALDNDPVTGTLVFQLDGRQPSLESQAAGVIEGHAQGAVPSAAALHQIAEFERTNSFFSSSALRDFFHGGPGPRAARRALAVGKTRATFLRGCSARPYRWLHVGALFGLP